MRTYRGVTVAMFGVLPEGLLEHCLGDDLGEEMLTILLALVAHADHPLDLDDRARALY